LIFSTPISGTRSALRKRLRKFGRLDVLHNNAGGSTAQDNTAVNAPLDEFWRAIKLDLYGTFLGCRFGIPELIKAGGGSVINMSPNVALMGVAGRDCYTAAKGGIAAITRSLAVAYAPQTGCRSQEKPVYVAEGELRGDRTGHQRNLRGTDSSNPSPSSGESGANCRRRKPGRP
jgi:NADP-dependent 3-hydroxy acid dehydrogenase YdfG